MFGITTCKNPSLFYLQECSAHVALYDFTLFPCSSLSSFSFLFFPKIKTKFHSFCMPNSSVIVFITFVLKSMSSDQSFTMSGLSRYFSKDISVQEKVSGHLLTVREKNPIQTFSFSYVNNNFLVLIIVGIQ